MLVHLTLHGTSFRDFPSFNLELTFGSNYRREKSGKTASMSGDRGEKLKAIDEELLSFYKYCENAGFSETEMNLICAPLTSALRQRNAKRNFKIVLLISGFLLCLYAATEVHAVNLHFTALGRLLMIRLLPFWDWTSMFYENCLISNPFYKPYSLQEEDCLSCEALEKVEGITDASFSHLFDNFLTRDTPVIVKDAMINWPIMKTDQFQFENISQVYLRNEKLSDTVPCVIVSNIRPGSDDLMAFLKRVQTSRVEKWFVHWQNCDINAVKALRKFYQRPYFLSTSVAPAHFNWVLMSSDYNMKSYKPIELDSGLIQLLQLRGATYFRLDPKSPCKTGCVPLSGELAEGEILVFTNFMWDFEYRPKKGTDNIAILTETIWDSSGV